MKKTPRILCVIGTRPEAVKMAPVVRALKANPRLEVVVLKTGQHGDLVDPILAGFGVAVDHDLRFLERKIPAAAAARRLTESLTAALASIRPSFVLAQGDTTSVVATAIACSMAGVPMGHVEAGLRSGDLQSPFPEEANRVVASHLTTLHFAPTLSAKRNLTREGVNADVVFVTGNPVIDALLATARRIGPDRFPLAPGRRLILATAHRREARGRALEGICRGVAAIHDRHPDIEILWPVHPNPAIRPVVERMLGGLERVRLAEPLDYESFVAAMARSTLILTDSGGVQEEAPALGKPVLVLRDETERPEALGQGVARLVGRDPERILAEASLLLDDQDAYRAMAKGTSPYGDGRAAPRIAGLVDRFVHARERLAAAG